MKTKKQNVSKSYQDLNLIFQILQDKVWNKPKTQAVHLTDQLISKMDKSKLWSVLDRMNLQSNYTRQRANPTKEQDLNLFEMLMTNQNIENYQRQRVQDSYLQLELLYHIISIAHKRTRMSDQEIVKT